MEGRLGRAVAPDQAEGPVRDRMAAREPLVRVGEAAGPGQALAVDLVEVHGQELRLLLLAVPEGVDPVFPEDERLLVRLVLQPLQVGPELLPPVEVDVHGVEVHRPGVQIFGGREAGERDQRPGILLVGEVDQLVDEALDLLVAEPAHDVGGNLVHDRQGEEGGVPAARARGLPHGAAPRLHVLPALEEAAVLGPRDVHEDLQAEGVGGVEQLPRRDVIDADRVRAQAADLAEVGLELMLNGQGDPALLRLEGSVGHSLDPELLGA